MPNSITTEQKFVTYAGVIALGREHVFRRCASADSNLVARISKTIVVSFSFTIKVMNEAALFDWNLYSPAPSSSSI